MSKMVTVVGYLEYQMAGKNGKKCTRMGSLSANGLINKPNMKIVRSNPKSVTRTVFAMVHGSFGTRMAKRKKRV